ncbi:Uncharacterised protein [Mycoplasmopsis californica]|uniref:Lipoprotein n=1 Tax=Mycoplasmopsis equigenitalium TaxID=114883 RepID=A0ABY5J0K9_9BACT|nr:hypothetical protein [Mycoplasmopsis equigenitalium]UUD36797.1 hypothetical protein NPA09_02770 [Mycoplasmopsis equigenitalium]VEU69905.1 Uncharacterised protein [Mycoplasmopsis californica]
MKKLLSFLFLLTASLSCLTTISYKQEVKKKKEKVHRRWRYFLFSPITLAAAYFLLRKKQNSTSIDPSLLKQVFGRKLTPLENDRFLNTVKEFSNEIIHNPYYDQKIKIEQVDEKILTLYYQLRNIQLKFAVKNNFLMCYFRSLFEPEELENITKADIEAFLSIYPKLAFESLKAIESSRLLDSTYIKKIKQNVNLKVDTLKAIDNLSLELIEEELFLPIYFIV